MKARLGWFIAIAGAGAIALSAAAQGSAKLAVGPDAGGYLCPDGRQLYVKSCYDNSPDAKCGVVNMHLPVQNGFQRESTETRSKLTPSVAACKVYPLEFRNDGTVGLVVPKSAAPQQAAKAPAATPAPKTSTSATPRTADDTLDLTVKDGMAFGQKGVRSSLVRIPANSTSRIFYVDEASRKATAQKDVITIWSLRVYVDGKSPFAGGAAVWVENYYNCKLNSFWQELYLSLDRQAKVLIVDSGDERGIVAKSSVNETIAGIACNPAQIFKGPRFASAKAAIADAFASAAPKTAAKPAVPADQPNAAAQAQQAFLEGGRLSAQGDDDAALAAFARATKLDPTLRAAWLRQAQIHVNRFDLDLAIPFYDKALELDPNDIEIADQLCTAYVGSDASPEKGIAACERLIKLKPKDVASAHSMIARLQQKRGDNQKALVSALEWARLEPAKSDPWTTLADIYIALGRNTDALAAMQKAVKLQPTNWSILAQRGDVFRRLGKSTESIADYKAGIAIWPEGPELHHDLSVVLRAAGRKTEADAEQRLAIDYALSKGRNALKKPGDGSSVSFGSILGAKHFLGMLEKWDKSAAAKLAAEIKAAEQ